VPIGIAVVAAHCALDDDKFTLEQPEMLVNVTPSLEDLKFTVPPLGPALAVAVMVTGVWKTTGDDGVTLVMVNVLEPGPGVTVYGNAALVDVTKVESPE
jgi:hypothetical protein